MRSQLRVRVVLPVAVLGLLGAGFGAFAFGKPPQGAQSSLTPPGNVTTMHAAPKKTSPVKRPAAKKAKRSKGSPLAAALRGHRVVVLVFYSPGSAYDTMQTREARAGAAAVNAGFVPVDVSKDRQVATLAKTFEVRDAPAILIVTRGPSVAFRINGYADREAIAQAAATARA
jgi:hypothetical protein